VSDFLACPEPELHPKPFGVGFLYPMLRMAEQAERASVDLRAASWRSRLHYHLARYAERCKLAEPQRAAWLRTMLDKLGAAGLERLGGAFRIPLSDHLYAR